MPRRLERRGVCADVCVLEAIPPSLATERRLDECEKAVRRETQTPMDQWPHNL